MGKPARTGAKRSRYFELVPLDSIRNVIEAEESTRQPPPRRIARGVRPGFSSSQDLPTAMSKCFVTRCQSTLCHIEIAHAQGRTKATPWVQDRRLLRPVLDVGRHHPEFLAHDEGAALFAVTAFLEERFGSVAELPRPCSAGEHIKTIALPLAWTDEVASVV